MSSMPDDTSETMLNAPAALRGIAVSELIKALARLSMARILVSRANG